MYCRTVCGRITPSAGPSPDREVGFLSVWVVRVPILVCLFAIGGVSIDRVIVAECLLLTAFLFLSGLALVGSFKAKSRQAVGHFISQASRIRV